MAQVKIYAHKSNLDSHRAQISEAIHRAVVSALNYPASKKFHRFIAMAAEDFIYPDDRSSAYTIIEISMFEGRSMETKKALIRAIFDNMQRSAGIAAQDVEITIFETAKQNWGIRGLPGDELELGYKVEV